MSNFEEYLETLTPERREAMQKLQQKLTANLPPHFEQRFAKGFLHFEVPKSYYPPGYHCNPHDPLPFISIASQKNFIALYHMGIYANEPLLEWFSQEYPKHVSTKLDMGKSCIRFKNVKKLPFDLIGELATKMTADEWVALYEQKVKR